MITTARFTALLLSLSFAAPALCADNNLPDTAPARFDFLDVNRDGVLSKYEYDNDVAVDAVSYEDNADTYGDSSADPGAADTYGDSYADSGANDDASAVSDVSAYEPSFDA